jgi:serine/threonine protein kinase
VITVYYRPPELLFSTNNHHYGLEIDIWSAGMVITELILGYNFTLWADDADLIKKLASIFDLSSFGYKSTPRGLSNYLNARCTEPLDPLLLDLVEKLMDVNPATRITAQGALNHPFFKSFTPLVQNIFVTRPNFLEPNIFDWTTKHTDINKEMRVGLIDWLKEVTKKFRCSVETYSQCIEIIDAYMTKTSKSIPRQHFQLIGCASFLVSSAMNEIRFVDPKELIYISGNIYSKTQITNMAWEIFSCLGHLMPRTRLTSDVVRRNSDNDLREVCIKYSTCFPTLFL